MRPDTEAFIELLNDLPLPSPFERGRELVVTRAPGRLDLMGGIADYSGSLVLQFPLAGAAHVALQCRADQTIRIISLIDDPKEIREYELQLSEFRRDGEAIDYPAARDRFKNAVDHWAAYVAGAFLALMREKEMNFAGGATILISSQV
ncbi:MAG: hypothetical protein J2P41_22025, partial [Blastocatellia bacterium]|nr:hypothetical protein [Blastocatellia bacterium]